MKISNIAVLLFIILISIFGLFKINQIHNKREKVMMDHLKPVAVVVALKPIKPGDKLTIDNLALDSIPVVAVDKYSFIQKKDLHKIENIKVRNYINRNDIIRFSDLDESTF